MQRKEGSGGEEFSPGRVVERQVEMTVSPEKARGRSSEGSGRKRKEMEWKARKPLKQNGGREAERRVGRVENAPEWMTARLRRGEDGAACEEDTDSTSHAASHLNDRDIMDS
ncbi:uncharacterized protein [Branchiostoma lanceolatum]|uniref:uncharacterized protein n=1 Tax=Branchiostoma lanceolatum TaxID=7740 RepID=UPI003453C51A